MLKFTEYLNEEQSPLQKAETALMAGDHETALHHLKQHVQGKSKVKDALHAKLMYTIKKKLNA